MSSKLFENICIVFGIFFSILLGKLFWGWIDIDFVDKFKIVGEYSKFKYNPLNESIKYVIFPIGFPGLLVGGIFVFILGLCDFVTPQLVGGTSGFTYGKIIYSNFGMAFNWPFGAALASILLFVSVIIIALTNYVTKKNK